MKQYRIIISGGGTGGHIFPAISIANTFRKRFPEAEILFVGADDRMEMEKVPAAGYRIVGPITSVSQAVCSKASSLPKRRYGSSNPILPWG